MGVLVHQETPNVDEVTKSSSHCQWAQAHCSPLLLTPGGGPLSQMHGKQVQQRQWFKLTQTPDISKVLRPAPWGIWQLLPSRGWSPGHLRLGAARQSACGNWLRCRFRKPAFQKGLPLVDMRKRMRCLCSVVSDSLQPHGLAHQAPLSMGFWNLWGSLVNQDPRLTGSISKLPDPVIKPMSFTSPALAGWVLYHYCLLGSWMWGSFLLIPVFPFHFGA